jgi:hypothetical protein
VAKGQRVVIPRAIRANILDLLHQGHAGIVRTKLLARSYVWWPGIDNIETLIKECISCQSMFNDSDCTELIRHWEAKKPWERMHIDFMEHWGYKILVLVDSYSKWIEVCVMSRSDAAPVIERLDNFIGKIGGPNIIHTVRLFTERWSRQPVVIHFPLSVHLSNVPAMASKSCDVDPEWLIKFIEERPVLWDRTLETYRRHGCHTGGLEGTILISSHWTKETANEDK